MSKVRSGAAFLLLLVSLCALHAQTDTLSRREDSLRLCRDAGDKSPQRLLFRSLLPGLLFAAYPADAHDRDVRQLRTNQVGASFRNRYDDVCQFFPLGMQFAMKGAGVSGRSGSWGEMLVADGVGAAGTWAVVATVKYATHRMRPDGSAANSFPSGHTATAFLGAELFSLEYGTEHPCLSALQFGVAALTGAGRIVNNRHWLSDVLWGAWIGVVMARAGYYASDLIFGRRIAVNAPPAEPSGIYISPFTAYRCPDRWGKGFAGVQAGSMQRQYMTGIEYAMSANSREMMQYIDLVLGFRLLKGSIGELWHAYGVGMGIVGSNPYTHLQGGIDYVPGSVFLRGLVLSLRIHQEVGRPSASFGQTSSPASVSLALGRRFVW